VSGGLGLRPDADPVVLALYPLHDHVFNRRWLRTWAAQWWVRTRDVTAVRDQYGEEVGFYFAFVNYYTVWLLPLAALGIVVHLTVGPYTMAHAAATVGWSALFLFFWRRYEREVIKSCPCVHCFLG
jgi:anoctamin-10